MEKSILGLMFAGVMGLWVSAYILYSRLDQAGHRKGPFYKRVYLSAAFTIAFVIMFLAYLTPSQN